MIDPAKLLDARMVLIMVFAVALVGQSDTGELRVKIVDQSGLPVHSSVEIVSQANQVRQKLETDLEGIVIAKRLPFGRYRIQVARAGFATFSDLVEVQSAIPKEYRITLGVAPIETVVVVSDAETLLDPRRTASVARIGPDILQDRESALPGRSLIDLVNMQPGWLLEANGVLHPRGSQYQTQYVVDGIPLMENRSPAFSPELEADDVQSMSVFTAGYPAEYGRKLGGVIEVVTARDSRPGFHGQASISGGSFNTLGGHFTGQYGWGRNTLSLSGDAARTDRYLDPPVEANHTNAGTNASFAAHYESDLTDHDRFGLIVRRGQSTFGVPNENVQQEAGQRQDRGSEETAGQFSYQHVFSPTLIGELRGMVRDLSTSLWSNTLATPIFAAQNRGFREAYFKSATSFHRGRHEWKMGVEADFGSVREAFTYRITTPGAFDPATPARFQFSDARRDREQAAFVQDLMRFGKWTINAGIRWDHYRLLVDQNAVSPRLGAAWYWPAANLVFRASYDRIFETPAFENLLLASSAAVETLSENVLHLPVRPARGNFYEGGFAKGIFGKLRLDANYFRRSIDNFADDDVLLNTGISFPISFRRAEIRGTEVTIEIPRWGPLSGFLRYSNMLGVGLLPVTGGLFLGNDTANLLKSSDRFPVSQDQRNSIRGRFRYQIAPRVWAATGMLYGSGLPVEFEGSYSDAVAQYGQRIVDRVNFERGRVRPSFSLSASTGILLYEKERKTVRIQVDAQNLTNRLNVINFAGVFSGTALAPPRSAAMRLQVEF